MLYFCLKVVIKFSLGCWVPVTAQRVLWPVDAPGAFYLKEVIMAILAECPICKRKQSNKRDLCSYCGENLEKAKRSKRVRYWIDYRIPGGKHRRELVGRSIEKARDAMGKRRAQKREGRIFDMMPKSKMTFNELTEWYLNLKNVRKLKSYPRVKIALKNFNEVFGKTFIRGLKNIDLEDYQYGRERKGRKPATIDMELTIAQTMVNKAFDNDKIDGKPLKAFRRTKKKLVKGTNARSRIVSMDEYKNLLKNARVHLKGILIVLFNTGMRVGEVRTLRWPYVDLESGFIKLPGNVTKEKRDKMIPINHHVRGVLTALKPKIRPVDDNHHDFVFTYGGRPIRNAMGPRKAFISACKKSNIPYGENGLLMKDFRRTVKTSMVAAGVSKVYRDTILGHSLKGMDTHYIKPSDEDLTRALGKYTQWIDGQFKNVDKTLNLVSGN